MEVYKLPSSLVAYLKVLPLQLFPDVQTESRSQKFTVTLTWGLRNPAPKKTRVRSRKELITPSMSVTNDQQPTSLQPKETSPPTPVVIPGTTPATIRRPTDVKSPSPSVPPLKKLQRRSSPPKTTSTEKQPSPVRSAQSKKLVTSTPVKQPTLPVQPSLPPPRPTLPVPPSQMKAKLQPPSYPLMEKYEPVASVCTAPDSAIIRARRRPRPNEKLNVDLSCYFFQNTATTWTQLKGPTSKYYSFLWETLDVKFKEQVQRHPSTREDLQRHVHTLKSSQISKVFTVK